MGSFPVGRKVYTILGHLAFYLSSHTSTVGACVFTRCYMFVCVPLCVWGVNPGVPCDLLKGLAVIPEFLCVKCLLWVPFTACVLYGPWSHPICLSLLHFWGLFFYGFSVFIRVKSVRGKKARRERWGMTGYSSWFVLLELERSGTLSIWVWDCIIKVMAVTDQ